MPAEKKQLTVGELIEALKKLPLHLPVWVEGCDCNGEAVSVEEDDDSVLIAREKP